MILKNYWKWLDAINKFNFWTRYEGDKNIGLVAIDGENLPISFNCTADDTNFRQIADRVSQNYNLVNNITIRVGASEHEVTSDSYTLENDITNNISGFSYNVISSADNGVSRIITMQGVNSGDEAITIKQVAICKKMWYIPSGYNYSQKEVMLAICILDEPIVVQPHNNFKFIFEWLEQ